MILNIDDNMNHWLYIYNLSVQVQRDKILLANNGGVFCQQIFWHVFAGKYLLAKMVLYCYIWMYIIAQDTSNQCWNASFKLAHLKRWLLIISKKRNNQLSHMHLARVINPRSIAHCILLYDNNWSNASYIYIYLYWIHFWHQ